MYLEEQISSFVFVIHMIIKQFKKNNPIDFIQIYAIIDHWSFTTQPDSSLSNISVIIRTRPKSVKSGISSRNVNSQNVLSIACIPLSKEKKIDPTLSPPTQL